MLGEHMRLHTDHSVQDGTSAFACLGTFRKARNLFAGQWNWRIKRATLRLSILDSRYPRGAM